MLPRLLKRSLLCLLTASLPLQLAAAEDLQPVDLFTCVPDLPVQDRNVWPAEWEAAFHKRFSDWIAKEEHLAPAAQWVYEKSGGGFMALFKGRRESALAAMRIQPPDSEHTNGIDFYWCFHLEKQPRYYFQFGKFHPPEFIAKMKAGAKLWTAEDPRPNLELVLLLDCPDAEVVAHAKKQLAAMWRNAEQLKTMIADARSECKDGQPANKLRFAEYLEKILPSWPNSMPNDAAAWKAWWKLISDGDWLIYEEYERRTNPRPHPKFGIGTGPVGTGWDPGIRGGWVDWRNTDNLRGMREVSVYLFAEETGNELIRKVYKERVRRTARGFYSVGNGEWDSPAYLGLTIQGYLMLYDFAKDQETRLLAKGILDYLATTTAVKFYRGGASGPNTRDYGTWSSGNGGGASRACSTWMPNPTWPILTHFSEMPFFSTYRPPAAVISFAAGEHTVPMEILASHPTYNNWVPGADLAPAYHETQYRSRDFQMGTQVEGGTGDGNGGKIVISHPTRGCDYLIPTSQTKGNPCVGGNDRIAQCRNALIWLGAPKKAKDGEALATNWRILIPQDAAVERQESVVFLRCSSAWVAIHPIACSIGAPDPKGIDVFRAKSKSGKIADSSGSENEVGTPMILPASAEAGRLSGFAIEVADGLHFSDYDAFKAAVLAKAKVQTADTKVDFKAASGARVTMTWDGIAKLPTIERDGKVHDWNQHQALWQSGSTGASPVTLGWKEGRLTVQAGDKRFTGTMDLKSGTYSFTNDVVKK